MVKLNNMENLIEKAKDGLERTRCEIFSRVCGYLRPVSGYNKGKKSEFGDRVTFDTKNDEDKCNDCNYSK